MSSDLRPESVPAILGVPARLRLLQEGAGVHRAEFLRRVKIPGPQWARYLLGSDMPRLPVLQRIAEATGRSVQWILLGVDTQPLQPADAARAMQPTLGDVTPPERAVFFPLVRALLELARESDSTFEHLLKQTRLLLRAERLELAPIDTAIKQFQRVRGKASDVTPSTRKRRAAKGLHEHPG